MLSSLFWLVVSCFSLPDSQCRYNIAPRSVVDKVLEDAYRQRGTPRPVVDLQSLALAFMVLAMGTLHNLELSPNDPMADDYVAMAKTCLVKDSFMTKNTIAGVQTLNVMAHYNLYVALASRC